MEEDRSIAFRVLTPSVDIHERFRPEEPVKQVLRWSLAAIGYEPSQQDFVLWFEKEELDPSKPIATYVERFGWKDGTTLHLVPRVVAAGAASR